MDLLSAEWGGGVISIYYEATLLSENFFPPELDIADWGRVSFELDNPLLFVGEL